MKHFNLFGTELNFNHDGSSQYKTSFGFILSIIFLVLTGVLISILGRDFFKRQNPKTRYNEKKNIYQFYDLKNSTFDFMFRIEDSEGNLFTNYNSLFKIRSYFYSFQKDAEGIYDGGYENVTIKFCNDIYIQSPAFRSFNLSQFLCFDKSNITLGGYWDHNKLNYMNFEVFLCDKEKDTNCDKNIDQVNFLQENFYYLAIYFQESVIDTEKYNDAIDISSKLMFFNLDTFSSRSINLFFKQAVLLSDYGWIFPDKKEQKSLGFDYFTIEYNKHDLSRMFNFYVYASKKVENTIREYPKIQSVIAETGGLLNFFILVFGSISKLYSINHLKLKVVNSIKQVKEDSKTRNSLKNCFLKNSRKEVLKILPKKR